MPSLRSLALPCIALTVAASSACSSGRAPAAAAAAPTYAATVAPYATIGTVFEARLAVPISSETASPGEAISARLDQPLVANDGSVVAPEGARLRGHVLGVDRIGASRLSLQFEAIEVDGRIVPIYARLSRVDGARVVTQRTYGAESLAAQLMPLSPREPVPPELGGGPQSELIPIELPANARIRFELVQPFSAPTATSRTEETTY